MSIKIKMSAFIALVSTLLFTSVSLAATQTQIDNARANGIAWLVQHQNGDGSWGDTDAATRMAATTESMEALRRSGAKYGHLFTRALSWVANTKTESVDSLARKIEQLEKEGLSSEELGLMQELMSYRDVINKCWGSFEYHSCSFPDTSLAMDAILNARITSGYLYSDDFATLDLIMSSHAPYPTVNGWSYIAAGDGSTLDQKIMPTAYNLITQLRYFSWYRYWGLISPGNATFSELINDLNIGSSWLFNRFYAVDGSFRDDPSIATGAVQSTALAYYALAAMRDYGFPFPPAELAELVSAQDFIISQQQADGSWEGGALVTALAVRSLPSATMTDTDNDGIPDTVETVLGTNPNVADGRGYLDNNGLDLDHLQNTGLSAPAIMRETVVNQAFSHTPTVSGGTPGYSWSLLTGSLPSGISLISSVTGALNGTPTYVGSQTFALQAQDATGNNIIVPVHIRVLATGENTDSDGDGYSSAIELSLGTDPLDANDVPTVPLAVDDSGYSLDQSGVLNTALALLPSVLANDVDSDTPNASLTAVLNTAPANGSLVLNGDGSFVYTHNGGQLLSDSFTYHVNDGVNNSPAPATVSIVISNVAPVAYAAALETTTDVAITGTLVADDIGGDALTYSLDPVNPGTLGSVVINSATGAYTYTPSAGVAGTDSFRFSVNDGLINSNMAVITVTIQAAVAGDASSVYTYGWSNSFGGSSRDYAKGVATDAAGNIYVIGHFESQVDFDISAADDSQLSNGSSDVYVTKLNVDGSYGWTRTFGGTGYDYGHAIAVDDLGNSYLTGGFSRTVDFDPGVGVDSRSAVNVTDIFVTKLNADGSYGWTRTFGGTQTYHNPYYGNGIALDNAGGVIITGQYIGTVNFDMTGPGDTHTAVGGTDIFLTKLGVDGSYGWTHSFGDRLGDEGKAVAVDASNNIYVTGAFSGTVDFDAGAGINQHSTSNGRDIFVMQYLPDGRFGWAKTVSNGEWLNDISYSLALGENGELYIAGEFRGTVDFDPGTGVDSYTATSADAFVSKWMTDGSYGGWTRTFGDGSSRAFSVAVGKLGDVFVGGQFFGTVDFDPGPGEDNYSAWGTGSDAFMTHLKANGDYGWTKVVRTYGKADMVRGIAVAPTGAVIEVGEYRDTTSWSGTTGWVDFDPGPGVDKHYANGRTEAFIRKWNFFLDSDSDGYMDLIDLFPYDSAEWLDTDGDLIGNNADLDDDNDGLPDDYELANGLDPLVVDAAFDHDGDGISTQDEYLLGTNPQIVDTDGDGLPDGYEQSYGLDPFNSVDALLDSDGDGISNLDEFLKGSDPTVAGTMMTSSHTYGWSNSFGGSSRDYAKGVATDAAGNIYVIGHFESQVDFDISAADDSQLSNGSSDVYVTKLNVDGSYGWTRTFGGTGYDYGHAIAVDDLGNSYLTGGFSRTVDFDPGVGVDSRSAVNVTDIFVTKLNADGSYGWTRTFGGTQTYHNPYYGNGIALDNAGGVIITGQYIGTVNFDMTGPGDTHTAVGGTDIFLTKLGVDGSYGWTHSFGDRLGDEGKAVAVDASNNIYVTGAFSGTVDFDAGAGINQHSTSNGRDIFVMQYLPDGRFGWAKTVSNGEWLNDISYSLALGENGELYIAGEFRGTVDFDPGTGVDSYTATSADAFVSKWMTDGSYGGWTRTFGDGSSRAFSVAVGKLGDVFVGGQFFGTVDFDPGPGEDNYSAWGTGSDAFMTHLKANGDYGWTKVVRTYGKADMVRGIAVAPTGAVIEVGEYRDTTSWSGTTGWVDFDPGPGVDKHYANGRTEAFIRKWSYLAIPDSDGDGVADINDPFPNDSSEWLDSDGDLIGDNADLDDDNDGMPDTFETTYQFNSLDSSDAALDFDSDTISNLDEFLGGTNPTVIDLAYTYDYDWTHVAGAASSDSGNGMVTDTAGNVYIVGDFSDTVDFDPTAGVDNHTAVADTDIYVTKHNADGSYGWTHVIGGIGADAAYDVALDSLGKIYIVGSYSDSVDFGAGIDTYLSQGGSDIFITQLNADGSYGWTQTFGGSDTDRANKIAIASDGMIYITGYFSTTVDFNPSGAGDSHTATGGTDTFFMKLNADGTHAWAHTYGGTGDDQGSGIAIDSSNNVYLTGNLAYSGWVDFNHTAGVDTFHAWGTSDPFVTKLWADGSYGWTRVWGGYLDDVAHDIAYDGVDGLYIVGAFKYNVDFNPESGRDTKRALWGHDSYLNKLRTDGTYIWSRVWGSATKNDAAYSVAVGSLGDVFVGGGYTGQVDFDPGATENTIISQSGTEDAYLSHFWADGLYIWTKSIGGGALAGYLSNDRTLSVTTASDGSVYQAGYVGLSYLGGLSIDFDPGVGDDTQPFNGNGDMFITRWNLTP